MFAVELSAPISGHQTAGPDLKQPHQPLKLEPFPRSPGGGLFAWPAGQFLGPAGAFTFGLKNVSFVGNPGVT